MSIAVRTLNANFNGGEITPLLDGRADASVYKDSCRVLENFVVRPYGGAFKRPGTQYGGETKTSSTASKLVSFKRSTNTNYMLEFGVNYIRVWTGGSSMAQVTVSGVTAWATTTAYVVGDVRSDSGTNYWCKTAHTSGGSFSATNWHAMTGSIFEMYSPYGASDLSALQLTRINDVMFIAHPSYAPRRLSHTSATSWALDSITWDIPPMDDVNDTSTTVTLLPNKIDWVTSTAYTVGQMRLVSGVSYMCLSAHTSGTFATDLAAAKWKLSRFVGPWERVTVYYQGDVVTAGGLRYACIVGHTAGDSNRPTSGGSYATNWLAVGDTGLRMFSSAAIFAPTDVGASWRIDIGANKRTIFLDATASVNTTCLTEPMLIQGDMTIRSNWASGFAVVGDLFLEESIDRITFNAVRQWSTTSQNDGNLSSTYSGVKTGRYYRLRFDSKALNASPPYGFFAEMLSGTVTALVTITSYVSTTEVACSFALPNITVCPTEILNKASVNWYRPAFSGTNGYPRSVAFHESRLFWAGTSGNPARLWASRTDDYYNYLINADDDSGLDLTLAALEANQAEWIVSQGQALVVGTTGEEWTIDSGTADAALTPTSARARRRTRRGSTTLPPQLVSDALLWVGRGGKRLHEFSYNFAADRYEAPDMTIFAEHITAGGIVQTSFAAEPDTILWAVTGAGTLIGLTYDRAQQITAWHRHTTSGGTFESVATMYGTSGRDEVWFIVNRTINGSTKRYVERFYPTAQDFNFDTATDLFYVDCGKIVAPSGTAVTGLSHLEAASVTAWSDGTRIDTGTVASGGLTLSASTTTAIVGIPITSKVQTMRLEIVLQDGTAQGRKFRANRVTFLLHKSMGGTFGDTLTTATQVMDNRTPYQIEQAASVATTMFTGRTNDHIISDWDASIDFTVQHSTPTPFNLLGYILVSEVSGT